MRGGLDVWWIGRQSCGEAGRSPKGARKRGGLDVEAAGGMAEVQKEQGTVVDWTLKLRGSRQRSKLNEKTCQIGHQSNRRASESPKMTSRS